MIGSIPGCLKMGYRTWGDLDGTFCDNENGVELGLMSIVRKMLNFLHEVFVEDDEDKIPPETWLHLPIGIEINITNRLGKVADFHEFIPKIEYWGVKYTILGQYRVCKLPKRNYSNMLSAVLAPIDHYFPINSDFVRRLNSEDEEDVCAYGLFSDTVDIIQWGAMIGFFVKWLKDLGLVQYAAKLIMKIIRWYKTRKMRKQIDDIHDMTTDISKDTDDMLDLLNSHLSRLTARRIME